MSEELKEVLLENYLGFSEYNLPPDPNDPGKEDISYLLYVAKLIPRTPLDFPKVDPRILASLLLAAHQTATELFARTRLWAQLRKIDSDSALGYSIDDVGGTATTAEKRAKKEEKYVNAAKLTSLGEAYVTFYASMLKNFETAHYWARDEETSRQKEKRMSGYEPHLDTKVGGSSVSKYQQDQQDPEKPVGNFEF